MQFTVGATSDESFSASSVSHAVTPTPKLIRLQCSSLAQTTGYGKTVRNKIHFNPIQLLNSASFHVETLLFFLKHKFNGTYKFLTVMDVKDC